MSFSYDDSKLIYTPPQMMPEFPEKYLKPGIFIDSNHLLVEDLAFGLVNASDSYRLKAIKLFYAVRDNWRYDPYTASLDPLEHCASYISQRESAHCALKAVLMCALARAVGIPSAIGLADVTNHFSSEKLRMKMGGSDIFINHGFALLFLEGQWVKVAPVFNRELCLKRNTRPTEFDGFSDAIEQQFDHSNNAQMKYVAHHGYWNDLPFGKLSRDLVTRYPNFFD